MGLIVRRYFVNGQKADQREMVSGDTTVKQVMKVTVTTQGPHPLSSEAVSDQLQRKWKVDQVVVLAQTFNTSRLPFSTVKPGTVEAENVLHIEANLRQQKLIVDLGDRLAEKVDEVKGLNRELASLSREWTCLSKALPAMGGEYVVKAGVAGEEFLGVFDTVSGWKTDKAWTHWREVVLPMSIRRGASCDICDKPCCETCGACASPCNGHCESPSLIGPSGRV